MGVLELAVDLGHLRDREAVDLGQLVNLGVVSISEEERERVLDPYQRTHPTRGLAASMGLSLTISRKPSRLMNGDLTYFGRPNRRSGIATTSVMSFGCSGDHTDQDDVAPILEEVVRLGCGDAPMW